jgi:probable HAF family extracellular repeat protein
LTWLDALVDGRPSSAVALNEAGQVAGVSDTGDAPGAVEHAVRWDDSAIVDLGALGHEDRSEAADINEAGQIAGMSDPRQSIMGDQRAVLWDEDEPIPLDSPL